jgi:hypothetical protein
LNDALVERRDGGFRPPYELGLSRSTAVATIEASVPSRMP